jgi:alpha-D-ribose 1-methylphosphonate 5-triphosphate synthase subunit PhnH
MSASTSLRPARGDAPPARADLSALGRGFADPGLAAQQVFRSVLEAMSRPGRVQTLPAAALRGMYGPGTLPGREPDNHPQPASSAHSPAHSSPHSPAHSPALVAVLLALLDAETQLWLDPQAQVSGLADHLRFHTGVVVRAQAEHAAFVVMPSARADASMWSRLRSGTDEQPQDGATWIVDVPALQTPGGQRDDSRPGTLLTLTGPGIEDQHHLQVAGLTLAFWQARRALEPARPRGVDLILCCADRVAAVPRSTRVAWEG